MCISNDQLRTLKNFVTLAKAELELATERSLTDSRAATDRALKTARDQAAADLDTFSARIADLAVNTAALIATAKRDLLIRIGETASDVHQLTADFHNTGSATSNELQARLDVDIAEAKQEFQDQRELCQKHAYTQREDLEARVDANIHALTQRVHRAESLPPIADAQDILQATEDLKNACHESRKAFEEDFSRLQSRLQSNIGSLTVRVRTLEAGPGPWDTTAIEGKQAALELRTAALERTANAHPDTDHEVFANDFARIDERLDTLEDFAPFGDTSDILHTQEELRARIETLEQFANSLETHPAPSDTTPIDNTQNQLQEDLLAHHEKLSRNTERKQLRLELRIHNLERTAYAHAVDPTDDFNTALAKHVQAVLHGLNLKYLQEHPPRFPGFTITKNPEPDPPT